MGPVFSMFTLYLIFHSKINRFEHCHNETLRLFRNWNHKSHCCFGPEMSILTFSIYLHCNYCELNLWFFFFFLNNQPTNDNVSITTSSFFWLHIFLCVFSANRDCNFKRSKMQSETRTSVGVLILMNKLSSRFVNQPDSFCDAI